jgi:hypothetical protein
VLPPDPSLLGAVARNGLSLRHSPFLIKTDSGTAEILRGCAEAFRIVSGLLLVEHVGEFF